MIDTKWQMVGTPRSGSNLLRLMMGQLPGFFAPPSVHIMRQFEEIAPAYGRLDNVSVLRALIADVLKMLDAVVLKWPELPTVDEVLKHCAGPSLEHVYIAVHDAAAARLGAVHWISKDLENVSRLASLTAAAPELRIVHLVRDPRDVALSFAYSPIHLKHPVAIAWKWAADQRLAARFRSQVPPSHWAEIQYEGLVRNAPAELSRICELSSVTDTTSILDFYQQDEAAEASELSALWSNLGRPLKTDNLEKYRRPGNQGFVRSVEEAIFDLMVECGYEPLYATRQRHFSSAEVREIEVLDSQLRLQRQALNDPEIESLHTRQRRAMDAIRQSVLKPVSG